MLESYLDLNHGARRTDDDGCLIRKQLQQLQLQLGNLLAAYHCPRCEFQSVEILWQLSK